MATSLTTGYAFVPGPIAGGIVGELSAHASPAATPARLAKAKADYGQGSSIGASVAAAAAASAAAVVGASNKAGKKRASKTQRKFVGTLTDPALNSIKSDEETWEGLTPGKQYRLQMETVHDFAKDTIMLKSLDWERDRFDIEFSLERGTSYNGYVIKGEKVAILDSSHKKFDSLYFEQLDKEIDWKTVSYYVCSHTEEDHSGLVEKIIMKAASAGNEDFCVVGSKVAMSFLEAQCFTPFKKQIIKNGEKLDLGNGHELEFVQAPNLHWPDTIFTFDHGTGVLYTCDAFGMHYCENSVFDTEDVQTYMPHFATYYECLMKPNARSVVSGCKKAAHLVENISMIATSHGPVLKHNWKTYWDQYQTWSDEACAATGPSMVIFWNTNFGDSERLSQLFSHGVTSTGVNVEMYDLNAVDSFEIAESLARCSVIALFAPEQNNAHATEALQTILVASDHKKHQFLLLSSCDEKQEPLRLLISKFEGAGLPAIQKEIDLDSAVVDARVMQAYEEVGMQIGKKMTIKTKKNKQAEMDKDMWKALGRINGSLYVVTAEKMGIRHAMIASWVTPASSDPIGITLTIAKDRAMEPLLRARDNFTLNFLEEGKHTPVMKHFLKKFGPGEDRLEGVDCFKGSNGAAVLKDAFAYAECQIVSRMDAGDHWVAYATVTGGDVSKAEAIPAVHRRKVATYY
eukprot:TRINITY_DN595_c0_g1_i2.p1 TRINITY_DN595_c0_g1~~TRINITY_DN595_c0_g1_i2.p1  ORF type:complete len:713 (+),score=200.46 TRINITY_DN595_c0_g1_i2:83-2140(+)